MTVRAKRLTGAVLIGIGVTVVYWHVFLRLVDAWIVDGNYSHGFFIIPIAAYFIWERKNRLQTTPTRPTWIGLVLFAIGIGVLLAGLLGSELFLSRISLIATLAGIVLFLFGWHHLRILSFPIAFLLLMIPLPAIIFNKIAFPLQLFASSAGETVMSAMGIPVLREGNLLILANTTLEVAEACSGIRSLMSLLTLALVYGYFTDSRTWVRTVIALSTIPVAIASNAARVAGTGIAAYHWGPAAAEGFLHEFSGWVVFVVAFLLMLAIQRLILLVAPRHKPRKPMTPQPPNPRAGVAGADAVTPLSQSAKS